MNQLPLQWTDEATLSRVNVRPARSVEKRARAADPATSHAAAGRAESFIGTHESKIYGWLVDQPAGATYRQIADATGLEPVAVARRLKGMQETAGVYADGVRERMSVWKVRR